MEGYFNGKQKNLLNRTFTETLEISDVYSPIKICERFDFNINNNVKVLSHSQVKTWKMISFFRTSLYRELDPQNRMFCRLSVSAVN